MPQHSPFITSHLVDLLPSCNNETLTTTLMMAKENKLIVLYIVDKYLHFHTICGRTIGTRNDECKKAFEPICLESSTEPIDNYYFDNIKMVEVRDQVYLLSTFQNLDKNLLEERIDRIIFDENNQVVKLECIYHVKNDFIRNCTPPIADSKRNCIYIVGGISDSGASQYAKDVVKISLETFEWEVIGSINIYPAMYCQSSLLWKEKFIIVFGGYNTSCSATSDILAFNVDSKEWSTLYSYDRYDRPEIYPIIYPLVEAGMQLVTNKWASQFDKSIPSNTQENTLIIYGGNIDCFVEKTQINRPTHQVFLFHLDESEWNSTDISKTRIPFNLTDYCTPDDRKLPPIHQRKQKNPVTKSRGILLEDGDDNEEYKLLPAMENVTMHKINNTQLLVIGNTLDCYLLSLNEQSIFTKFHSNNKLSQLSDISTITQTF